MAMEELFEEFQAKKLRGVAFERPPTKVSRLRAASHWRQISSSDVRAVSRGRGSSVHRLIVRCGAGKPREEPWVGYPPIA
jgi:hypothetical protein